MPNSPILDSHVVNYSALRAQARPHPPHDGRHRLRDPVAPGRGDAAQGRGAHAGLLRSPPPFVLQTALGDFAVTYELNVYCDDAASRWPRLYTALHRNILDVFNEYGMQIMTPAYEGDPADPKVVPKDQWFTAPAPAAG